MIPPAWHRTPLGGLRRRLGPASLLVYRDDRRRWHIRVELPADAGDEAEAAALAEAVCSAFLDAPGRADSTQQRSA